MILLRLLVYLVAFVLAGTEAKIVVHPITDVNEASHEGYFSDPYHVPYEGNQKIYISVTTPDYIECDTSLAPKSTPLPAIQKLHHG